MSSAGPPKQYDIITFGDMCVDLIMSGDDVVPQFGQAEKLVGDYELEMGGSCSIFACQAARLGMRVGILGKVGDDDFGRLILRRLGESGVDTQHVVVDASLKTGLGVALCQADDRAILTFLGSLNALGPQDVSDDFLKSARHLHHGSFFLHTNLRDRIPQIFRRARSFGLTTSLDSNWDPDERWNSTLAETLLLTDVFLPNEQEACSIGRVATVAAAIQEFQARGIPVMAIKRGLAGAVAVASGEKHTCVLPAATGGDSVGAGDSFDAAFLTAWLRRLPLDQCLAIASHCGREVAAQSGGLRGQPDWQAVIRLAGISNRVQLNSG